MKAALHTHGLRPAPQLALLLVAAAIALLACSGCGGGGDQEPEPESPPQRKTTQPVHCTQNPRACI